MSNQFPTTHQRLTTADSGRRDMSTVRLGVFHTTENNDNTSPVAVAEWQQDRNNESSYNVLFGTNGETVRGNDDNYIPWSAGRTGNRLGIHGSAVGRAARSRADWLKFPKQLEAMAQWAADLNRRYGIPLRWLTPEQVRSGSWGFCGHLEISKAWNEVNHTDPGAGFPHDVVLARAKEINSAPKAPPKKDNTAVTAPKTPKETDLILDQLAGYPWQDWAGWPQLAGLTLVDAVATIGAKLEIDGFKDMRK